MAEYYLVIKSIHIISIISWMAGMLYLPRLYVHHVGAKPGGELDEKLKIMERKLLRIIINPAMVFSLVTGVMLVMILGHLGLGKWFYVKAIALVGMLYCHAIFSIYRKDFANGINKKTEKYFRIINEAPTLLMIIIVVMAVVKPF